MREVSADDGNWNCTSGKWPQTIKHLPSAEAAAIPIEPLAGFLLETSNPSKGLNFDSSALVESENIATLPPNSATTNALSFSLQFVK